MNPPQTSELMPCPFCGGQPNIKPYQSGFSLQHHCNSGMYIGLWGFWSDIEKHWNHRTPSQREVEMLQKMQQLKEAIEMVMKYKAQIRVFTSDELAQLETLSTKAQS